MVKRLKERLDVECDVDEGVRGYIGRVYFNNGGGERKRGKSEE